MSTKTKDTDNKANYNDFFHQDPTKFAQLLAQIAEKSQKIVSEFLSRQDTYQAANQLNSGASPQAMMDPLNVTGAFLQMTTRMMANPQNLAQANMDLWQDYMQLWQNTAQKFWGDEDVTPVVEVDPGDRRFKDEEWQSNQVFDYIKQSYLLASRYLQGITRNVEGLDEKTAQKIDFYTRQFVDAMSPSNFVLTNPMILRETVETKGENLLKGLQNLLDDLERGQGQMQIKMTDLNAFKVGENIAATPGKIVFQNEMMQLIQYEPSTKDVHKVPLLIMPPWINKYYILDLKPENSFVKWAVDQGFTVFLISWVNPDERHRDVDFGDYMMMGPMAALDAIKDATGEEEVNIVGYCIGGTLLACMMAYMQAHKDTRIKSATYFTTMLDFEDPGDLGVFIDDEQLGSLEAKMKQKGYLEGHEMATTFNLLRANDLIWSFVINNYLMGREPFPFDLLYWNSDSTRLPAAMHSFYLRKMYQQNLLVQPGGITLKDTPIDLGTIKTPTFMISTREDHIAPWKSTYRATQIFKGPVKFVLAASGHIAGVVNHPDKEKYAHWLNDDLPENPDQWLKNSSEHKGSWWPVWAQWLKGYSGSKVATSTKGRTPGTGKLKAIEDAPGSYVKTKV